MLRSVGLYVCSSSFPPRYRGEVPDKEAFDKQIAKLSLKLDVYDEILGKQKYLVGDVRHLFLVDKRISLINTFLFFLPSRKLRLLTFITSLWDVRLPV